MRRSTHRAVASVLLLIAPSAFLGVLAGPSGSGARVETPGAPHPSAPPTSAPGAHSPGATAPALVASPALAGESSKRASARKRPKDRTQRGEVELDVESIEGLILLPVKMTGPSGVDTSGLLVLDTGAGFVALDLPVALRLGVTDTDEPVIGVELAEHPLKRLELGGLQIDHVEPVLVLDAEIIRRATGRNVLGLAGVSAFHGRALWLDYDGGTLSIIDAPRAQNGDAENDDDDGDADDAEDEVVIARSREVFEGRISSRARAARFRFAGDEKMIVRARLASAAKVKDSPWLDLVLDTGATKSVLFDPEFTESVPEATGWRSLRGLVAPTLVGAADARLTLVPIVDLDTADEGEPFRRQDVDCAVVESDLGVTISNAVGSTVYGLLGYSFLKGSRVGIDCTNQVLWVDPTGGREARPYEYSQVGLQLERDGDVVRVLAVAERSPAAEAGIRAGDELVSLAGKPASAEKVVGLTRALEGPPGTSIKVVMRRAQRDNTYVLVRRRLL